MHLCLWLRMQCFDTFNSVRKGDYCKAKAVASGRRGRKGRKDSIASHWRSFPYVSCGFYARRRQL